MGQSRTEDILENMLGADNELQPPQSRVERLLMQLKDAISAGGGGGGGGSQGISLGYDDVDGVSYLSVIES